MPIGRKGFRKLEDVERQLRITERKRAGEERMEATVLDGLTIADAMIDGLVVTDPNGNIIFVNRAMDEYLAKNGADAKELVGKSALDLPTVRPEDTEKFVELMKEVVEKGGAGPLEVQDVAGRWASITASLLKDANGNPSALFAVRRDITELKRAEVEQVRAAADRARAEEIEKKAQKMRLIYDGSRKMTLALELDEICNRALELACTALEADGGSVMTFDEKTGELVVIVASGLHKEIAMGKRLKLGERFAGHAAQMKRALFMHDVENEPWFKSLKKFEEIKSGMSIPLLVKDKLVGVLNLKRTQRKEKFDKSDVKLVSILADYAASIIERNRVEEKLRRSEASLAEAQRIAHLGNWDWGIVKNELRWSDEIYRIFGLKPREFGATYEAFLNSVHPDDREFVKKSVDEALNQRKYYSIDHRIVLPDASERIVHAQAEVFLGKAGRPIRMVGTIQDITELKRAEGAIRKAYDELEAKVAERTEELSQANIRLKGLDKLKSMFLASMSHELRTPLNTIIGFTGIMLQSVTGEITEEQRKQLTMVKSSANHLLALINDVIDVSKIEAGKIELDIEEFNLSNIAQEVKDSFKAAAEKKGLELSLEMPKELVIKSDERRTKQVIMNFVSNALKFTDKGKVEMTVAKEDGKAEVSVRDTGIGIKKEHMDTLFKAFSQTPTEGRPTQEGTGLGLYLSKKIVDLLGGEIKAESEFGKGSVFTFTLPLK